MVVNNVLPINDTVAPRDKAALYGKMAQVMQRLNRLPESGTNAFHHYTYATASDVADAVRAAMADVGLAFFVSMAEIDQETVKRAGSKGERTIIRTHAVFEFTFACAETGATHTCRWEAEAEDDADKGINKVATVAQKYFLMKTFIVSTGQEDESDPDRGNKAQSQRQQPPARNQDRPATTKNPPRQQQATGDIKDFNDFWQKKWKPAGLATPPKGDDLERILGKRTIMNMNLADVIAKFDAFMAHGKAGVGEPAAQMDIDENGNEVLVKQHPAPATETDNAYSWDDEANGFVDEFCMSNFGLSRGSALELVGKLFYSDLGSPMQAMEAIKSAAYQVDQPFVAHACVYVQDGKSNYVRFETPVHVRLYSRDALRALGADWKAFAEAMKPGAAAYHFEAAGLTPLRISYERKDAYAIATEIEVWDGVLV